MRHKKTQLPPLPLQAVREFEEAHQHCWEGVQFMRDGKTTKELDWDDLCYVPIGASQAVLERLNDREMFKNAPLLSALAGWRIYKEIYRFTPELRDLLFEQADGDLVVPIDAIMRMPYPVIYIDISDEEQESGFFVFFDDNRYSSYGNKDFTLELRFYELERQNGQIVDRKNLYLHLHEGWTVSDGINDAMKQVPNFPFEEAAALWKDILSSHVNKYIQLLLYICAQNADISEAKGQKHRTERGAIANPKDTYREIRQWDVGVKIAKIIRKSKENGAEPKPRISGGKHNSPRPHTRRGHWHHFWVGSRTDPDNRKQIIRWVAPTFVGGDTSNVIVTENILQDEK